MADEKPSLELQPKLKIKRLNRLAILLAAAVGILVLWVVYFALQTQPRIVERPKSLPRGMSSPAADRLALDRLEELARQQAAKDEEPFRELEEVEKREPSPEERRARQRLLSAHDAKAIVHEVQPRSRDLDRDFDRDLEQEPPPEGLLGKEVPAELQPPGPRTVQQGTLIPAILTAGIHSELPGQTSALVRHNVYDTLTGRNLLIPQGSRLLGTYDHDIVWGQRRVLVTWNRLVFSDGRSLDLASMPGVDLAAISGLRDQVDNQYLRTFGGALLLSAISAGAQLSQPQESASGDAPSERQILAAAMGQELSRTASEVTRRNLNVQPTLNVRPGYLFNVQVTADLEIPDSGEGGSHAQAKSTQP